MTLEAAALASERQASAGSALDWGHGRVGIGDRNLSRSAYVVRVMRTRGFPRAARDIVRHRRLILRAILVCVCCACAVPASAIAGTISLVSGFSEGDKGSGSSFTDVSFVDQAEERNVLTINHQDGTLEIRDAASPIQAGAGCASVDEHRATCTASDTYHHSIALTLGGGDDEFRLASLLWDSADRTQWFLRADGGAGHDLLDATNYAPSSVSHGVDMTGGDGDDQLLGTNGSERLEGGPGNDLIDARSGNLDQLDGGLGDDHIDGGAGYDYLDYGNRTAPIVIDLSDDAGEGEAGESDRVSGIDRFIGGRASDRFVGTDGPDTYASSPFYGKHLGGDVIDGRGGNDVLQGTPRDDHIIGGNGNDRIEGGAGPDRLAGGAGDDLIASGPPSRSPDAVSCGRGADVVDIIRSLHPPTLRTPCERILLEALQIDRWTLRNGRAQLHLSMHDEFIGRCRLRVESASDVAEVELNRHHTSARAWLRTGRRQATLRLIDRGTCAFAPVRRSALRLRR
jgi:hypothetical protein